MAQDLSRFFPPKGAAESDILAYRDRQINRFSLYRNSHIGRVALSIWYYLGRQWAEFDMESSFDGIRGSILRVLADDGHLRPVTNEIAPAVEQEVIALVKRGWVPKVTPGSNDPRIKAAAQVSHDILNYQLKRMEWAQKRRQLGVNFVTGGTGIIYTASDRSYAEMRTVAVPGAMACTRCSTRLFSAEVPVDTLRQGIKGQPVHHLETAKDVEMDPDELAQYDRPQDMQMAKLSVCPTCEEPVPLVPYEPTPQEAEEADDVFGRPLGMMEPRHMSILEIDLPHEWYPENGGARVTPDTLRRWGRRKIRSLEWWEEHAPHVVDQIDPDPISDLIYDDPILGDWSMYGAWSPSLDQGILDHHANADELVELPSFRHPLGRYVLCSKNKVVIDEDLLEESEVEGSDGKMEISYVARANVSISRYDIRPTEIWGTNLPEKVISPQNRLNTMDSQIVEERERLGGVSLMMTRGMWMDDDIRTDTRNGVTARVVFFEPDPSDPTLRPIPFGGQLFNPEVYMERDRTLTDIRHLASASEAASGENPKGVGNTSQLQLLIEQDEKKRVLREDDLIGSVERAWTHISQMEWLLRTDPDIYRVLGPDKSWKYEQYVGSAIRGQYEIEIEKQSYISKSVMKREAAREALADQLIVLDSPVARRRLLEEYGLDTDINEDTNNQVDQAERQWVDFVQKGIVRVQDSIDEPSIRYQVLGTHLLTDEGQRLTEEVGWDEISRVIAGWELKYDNLVMMEMASIAFYGDRLNQQQGEDAYTQATLQFQKSEDDYAQQKALFDAQSQVPATPGALPPVAPVPPSPPPPVAPPIPVLLQDRIYMVWSGMCMEAGIPLEPPAGPPPVDAAARGETEQAPDPRAQYVKMRALVEAYRRSIIPGTVAPGTGSTSIPIDKGGPVVPSPMGGPAAGGMPQPANAAPMNPMPEGGKQ